MLKAAFLYFLQFMTSILGALKSLSEKIKTSTLAQLESQPHSPIKLRMRRYRKVNLCPCGVWNCVLNLRKKSVVYKRV